MTDTQYQLDLTASRLARWALTSYRARSAELDADQLSNFHAAMRYTLHSEELPKEAIAAELERDELIWLDEVYAIVEAIRNSRFHRDTLSQLAIEFSLCPMHFCDWAACFDDGDAECEQIRAIFPYSHDT